MREALLLLLLAVVEVAAFLGMGFMRPDIPMAMEAPSFWWKLTSMGLIAVLGAGAAILSADPVRSPRRGLRWILVCIVAILASGWLIDAAGNGLADLVQRLDWSKAYNASGRWWCYQSLQPSPWAKLYDLAHRPTEPERRLPQRSLRSLGGLRLCLRLPLR